MRPGVASWIADEKRRRRGLEALCELGVDEPADAAVRNAQRRGRQLGGGHAGHPVHQLVRLVDHQQLVFGQHGGVGHRVDGQQRVIGDDDIGVAGLVAGLLREAVGPERAAGHADALPGRHGNLRPRPVRHARRQLVTVAGVGGRRPCDQPLHVAAQRGGGHRLEQLLLRPVLGFGRRSVVNLVEAQVVSAPLQQRELRSREAGRRPVSRPAAAGRGRRAGAAARWSRSTPPRARRCRRPARSRAPDMPATCRSRCRPAPRGARRCRMRAPPPRPSRSGRSRSLPPSAATALASSSVTSAVSPVASLGVFPGWPGRSCGSGSPARPWTASGRPRAGCAARPSRAAGPRRWPRSPTGSPSRTRSTVSGGDGPAGRRWLAVRDARPPRGWCPWPWPGAAPACGRRGIPCGCCVSRPACRRPRPACRPCWRSGRPSR